MLKAGVLGVKSFLIDSGIEEFPNVNAEDISLALPILAKHDVPYLIHAELDCGHQKHKKIGSQYQSFLQIIFNFTSTHQNYIITCIFALRKIIISFHKH